MRDPENIEMYRAILQQPDVFRRVALSGSNVVDRCRRRFQAARRVGLVGIGSSLHAARYAAFLSAEIAPEKRLTSDHSFDIANGLRPIDDQDLTIFFSHRGTKTYTVEAMRRARREGRHTLLLTGQGAAVEAGLADDVLETSEQERSSAHTVSLTSAVAAFASILELTETRISSSCEAMARVIESRSAIEEVAREVSGRRHVWLVGDGVGEVTAHEAALKLRETSYRVAEAFMIEELIHGPFQAADPGDLFILIAGFTNARDRLAGMAAMINDIGARTVVVGNGKEPFTDGFSLSGASPFEFNLAALVWLQFFSLFLALLDGTNPDSFRLEDPRFARAHDRVVF